MFFFKILSQLILYLEPINILRNKRFQIVGFIQCVDISLVITKNTICLKTKK